MVRLNLEQVHFVWSGSVVFVQAYLYEKLEYLL